MRGFDKIFMDLVDNKPLVTLLLDKILEIQSGIYETILEEVGSYLDIATLSSDMGTQSSLLISPGSWKEFIRPREETHIKLLRKKTNAKIALHSCGAIRPLIPEYIDMGIEILNPVQTTAKNMAPVDLKREFGKDLCFWGGIDTQKTLPYGSPEEVEKDVLEKVAVFAPEGGYLFATCQNIQDEVPPQNIAAMYNALDKCGEYASIKEISKPFA